MDRTGGTVIEISSPADLVGLLPYRLGFHPSESIVVVCLKGRRRRDALVMRLDLPHVEADDDVALDLAARAAKVGSSAAILVCYSEGEAGEAGLARQGLIDALCDAFDAHGIDVVDALLVSSGRWWSYHCDDPACCPPSGSAVPAELTPAAARFAAEAVAQGEVVLRNRGDLVRSIRPPAGCDAAAQGEEAVATAARRLSDAARCGGAEALRVVVMTTLRALLGRWSRGRHDLPAPEVAVILLGLRDKVARDEAMTLVVDSEPDIVLAMLSAMARCADDNVAAPICTVLAWAAYANGDGALANVAIERALDCEPAYELARLIESGLEAMVTPEQVRRVAQLAREDARGGAMS